MTDFGIWSPCGGCGCGGCCEDGGDNSTPTSGLPFIDLFDREGLGSNWWLQEGEMLLNDPGLVIVGNSGSFENTILHHLLDVFPFEETIHMRGRMRGPDNGDVTGLVISDVTGQNRVVMGAIRDDVTYAYLSYRVGGVETIVLAEGLLGSGTLNFVDVYISTDGNVDVYVQNDDGSSSLTTNVPAEALVGPYVGLIALGAPSGFVVDNGNFRIEVD